MSKELKPCPFCPPDLSNPKLIRYSDSEHIVKCRNCGCACGCIQYTPEQAVDVWNTRAERTCSMIDNGVELCCSVCDERHNYDDEPDYCKGCGAKVVCE